ncbi:unnamed protein product, partial [Symbiodinium sp. CCMP2592]
ADRTFLGLQEAAERDTYAARYFETWNKERLDNHRRAFPLNDNLLALLFLVQSDLNEMQRERLVTALTNQGHRIETYTYPVVRQTMFDQFSTTRTGLQDPNIRHSSHKKDRHGRRDQRRKRGGRNFLILDQCEYDGVDGFWLQDEDTLEEGFLAAEDEEAVFWTEIQKGKKTKNASRITGKSKGWQAKRTWPF